MSPLIALLFLACAQDSASDVVRKAEKAFQEERYADAVDAWRQVLDLPPKPHVRVDALWRLAACFEKLKRPVEARGAYVELLAHARAPMSDRRQEITGLIARTYESEKLWEEALRFYGEAMELPSSNTCIFPDSTQQYLKLDQARCLAELGRTQGAKAKFDDVILRGAFHMRLPREAVTRRLAIAASEGLIEEYERQLQRSAEERPREPGPAAVLIYLRIQKCRAGENLEGLWTALNECEITTLINDRYDWEKFRDQQGWIAAEAVECLAGLGDPAVDFLEGRARIGSGYGHWALITLARVDSGRARRLIGDLKWVEGYKSEDLGRGLAKIAAAPKVPKVALKIKASPAASLNLDREEISRDLGPKVAAVPGLLELLARGTPVSRTHALAEAARLWRKGLVTGEELDPLWSMARKEQWTLDWRSLTDLASYDRMEVLARVLAPALRHANSELRVKAAEAMFRHRHSSSIPELAAFLGDPSFDMRRAVLNGLARPEAIEYADRVAPMLKNDEPSLRTGAAFTLSRMKAARHIPDIAELLKDNTDWVRRAAVESLDHLGARQCAEQIRPLLKDSSDEVRKAAGAFLARHGGEDPAALEAPRLKSPDPKVRIEALSRLGSLGARAHAKAVAALLADPEANIRSDACMWLGSMGAREHIPALGRALKDPAMRAMACWALGRMAAVDLAGEIVPLLGDDEEFSRIKAAGALSRMGLREHAGKIAALLKDPSGWVRGSAALKLAVLGSREHIPDLVRMLAEDPEARHSALNALGLMEARECTDAIAAIVKEGDEDEAVAAAYVLALWGATDKAPLVRRLLKSEEAHTQKEAALCLAMMGDAESVPDLERLEKGRDRDAGWAASCALLRLGRKSPAAERELLRTAADLDGTERSHHSLDVMKALSKRHGREAWEKLAKTVETREAILDEAGLGKFLESAGLRLEPLGGVRLWSRIPPGLKVSAWGVVSRMLDDAQGALLPDGSSLRLATVSEGRAWWLERLK